MIACALDTVRGAVETIVCAFASRAVHFRLVLQSLAGGKVSLGYTVVYKRLMFENHQRHNIAVGGKIFVDRQPVSQFNDVLTLRIVDRFDDVPSCAVMRLPRCVCVPCVPVTYHPPQRSESGVVWSTAWLPAERIGWPLESTKSERTRCPGTPSVREELWHTRQFSVCRSR